MKKPESFVEQKATKSSKKVVIQVLWSPLGNMGFLAAPLSIEA